MSEAEVKEIHAIVSGNVQGVGFRATTRYHAKRLGLVGSVRNLPDGTVEIFVFGKANLIDELFKQLIQTIGEKNIYQITKENIYPSNKYQGFNIIS